MKSTSIFLFSSMSADDWKRAALAYAGEWDAAIGGFGQNWMKIIFKNGIWIGKHVMVDLRRSSLVGDLRGYSARVYVDGAAASRLFEDEWDTLAAAAIVHDDPDGVPWRVRFADQYTAMRALRSSRANCA